MYNIGPPPHPQHRDRDRDHQTRLTPPPPSRPGGAAAAAAHHRDRDNNMCGADGGRRMVGEENLCPELLQAVEGVKYIADVTRKEEESNKVSF